MGQLVLLNPGGPFREFPGLKVTTAPGRVAVVARRGFLTWDPLRSRQGFTSHTFFHPPSSFWAVGFQGEKGKPQGQLYIETFKVITVETCSVTNIVSRAHAGWCMCCIYSYIFKYIFFSSCVCSYFTWNQWAGLLLHSAVASVLHTVTPCLSLCHQPGLRHPSTCPLCAQPSSPLECALT